MLYNYYKFDTMHDGGLEFREKFNSGEFDFGDNIKQKVNKNNTENEYHECD